MTRSRIRLSLPFGFVISVAACSPELLAPQPAASSNAHRSQTPSSDRAVAFAAQVIVGDALDRILPALADETAAELRRPLVTLDAALDAEDHRAARGTISLVRVVLERFMREDVEHSADLAAVELALVAAEASLPNE